MADMDLGLVPIEQLISELLGRCDVGVIGLRKDENNSIQMYKRHWVGDTMTCLGLCDAVKSIINIDFEGVLVDDEVK